jgi:hypothetical protein
MYHSIAMTQMSALPPVTVAATLFPQRSALWQKVYDSILDLARLQDDWDGEGSSRPDSANISTALRWAEEASAHAPPPTQVVPGGAGELQLVWLWPDNDFRLEVEFAEPGKAEWMCSCPGRESLHFETAVADFSAPSTAATIVSAPHEVPANAVALHELCEAA